MAAGDISRRLVSDIRDELSDQSRELIKTDNAIYNKLTHYQKNAMMFFQTSRVEYGYPLTQNKSDYYINERIMNITKVDWNDELKDELGALPVYTLPKTTPYDDTRKIILTQSDKFVTGRDEMTVIAFIRPLETDVISATKDPIIETGYHFLLKECVLSHYRHLHPEFRPLETVERDIKRTALKIRALERSQVKPMISTKLNF